MITITEEVNIKFIEKHTNKEVLVL